MALILDDCERPLRFLRNALSGTSSKVHFPRRQVRKDGKLILPDMQCELECVHIIDKLFNIETYVVYWVHDRWSP
ncbi:hypothetical protein GOBAR_AA39593 [Gossypium barbadense]|uniref:Uncharacterized protein n=1 Tax=Gossypium barbadense TaxID=3634 RepID=A0A2P5VQK3_GOSBA|nr:hypothetical protein GOBAR_AA39593 [Gossypium barbadense]